VSAARQVLDRSNPPAAGPLRPFHFPEIHRETLPNGVEVRVAEAHDFPVASFGVVLRAGCAHEDEAHAGVAVLAGDLLETGAAGRTGMQIAEALESLGVVQEASTSWDSTYVGFGALRSRVEPAAELLGDLVLHPDFPAGEVERLRGERLAAIAQRRASPGGLASEAVLRFIYAPGSPFTRPLGGTPHTVEGITRPELVAFHAARYTPQGAVVVAAGDVTPAEAVELAKRRFGGWAGATSPTPAPDASPYPSPPGIVLVDRPGSVQSEIRAGHVGISHADADYFPVLVMNQILGGAFSSRLNLNLRETHGYTYGVSSSFAARRAPGPFLISTAVQSEVTAPAIREILHEVRGMRDAPPRREEIDDARSYLAGVFPLRLETVTGIASRLVELVVHDLPDDYFDQYRDRVLAVSGEDVLRAAREHLRPEEMAVLVVGDAAQLREPLEALGAGEVRVVEASAVDG
jgi:zinc protease